MKKIIGLTETDQGVILHSNVFEDKIKGKLELRLIPKSSQIQVNLNGEPYLVGVFDKEDIVRLAKTKIVILTYNAQKYGSMQSVILKGQI